MKRGSFLFGAAGGLAIAANTGHVFARALSAAPLPGLPGAQDRVLVLINLQGGNDGLNCVVPYGDSRYFSVRPTMAVPASDVLAIDRHIGFNPGMRSLKSLYEAGKVAIVQDVGYPNPDHSHFRSTEIWQTAAPDRYEHTGWLGRYLDSAAIPSDRLFTGVALTQVLPEVLIADHTDVPAIAQLNGYRLMSDRNGQTRTAYTAMLQDDRMPFSSPYLAHVAEIEDHAQKGSEELPKLISGYKPSGTYPATPLGRSLALAAQMIGSRIGTRVLYVAHGSFDTHVSQKATHDRLLTEFSNAVKAFYDDLAAHGNDGRVLTMTFSEFGRRIAENASRGTDHGEASPLFLIGGGVKGGIYGTYPDLSDANMGNVRFQTDFRSVYATVLERWLGRSSEAILRGRFSTLSALA
ncbi:MAG TPA: DUF1501 domain-containing protein [Candidatus Baltobacteraceae bacterium]|jgi:uncharacterized protein (DUF1501 family)|nr:DUF1501 domain-containing protein [Candidatus Baltobacteraceae bacterium]